jgi:hypothetical protein
MSMPRYFGQRRRGGPPSFDHIDQKIDRFTARLRNLLALEPLPALNRSMPIISVHDGDVMKWVNAFGFRSMR